VQLIRSSLAILERGDIDKAGQLFYDKLFEIAPETRALFRRPIVEQGGMLMQTLSLSVQLLDDLSTLVPALQQLAVRHERYGTTIAQFGPVGEALLDTLGKCTGDAFTPEVQDAWIEVYSLILTGNKLSLLNMCTLYGIPALQRFNTA
jgi:hemoglobin-like flavoprotein